MRVSVVVFRQPLAFVGVVDVQPRPVVVDGVLYLAGDHSVCAPDTTG